jgi:DNA-binding MarR family transcriptional regulator
MSRFLPLDPLIHVPLRMAIVSTLIGRGPCEFSFLKGYLSATGGNLSVQLSRLEEAGYIRSEKVKKPMRDATRFSITDEGVEAFENYLTAWKTYLPLGK